MVRFPLLLDVRFTHSSRFVEYARLLPELGKLFGCLRSQGKLATWSSNNKLLHTYEQTPFVHGDVMIPLACGFDVSGGEHTPAERHFSTVPEPAGTPNFLHVSTLTCARNDEFCLQRGFRRKLSQF